MGWFKKYMTQTFEVLLLLITIPLKNVRKYHTMLLIITFLSMVVIFVKLYQDNQNDIRFKYGNKYGFNEYKPGIFLKNRQPTNVSYCSYNYGLPNKIDWSMIKVKGTPELGLNGSYRVIYNAIRGVHADRHRNITYATHATPKFIYHIVEIARYWQGPISLAIFAPDSDMDMSVQVLSHLCSCYKEMSKVSVHFFYTKGNVPMIMDRDANDAVTETMNATFKLEMYKNLTGSDRARYINTVRRKKASMFSRRHRREDKAFNIKFDDCSGPDWGDLITFREQNSMSYPINAGRNIARHASETVYILVSDIEFVPSDGLAERFVSMLRSSKAVSGATSGNLFGNTVFVVPLFEFDKYQQMPRNKNELIDMVDQGTATYFHQKSCPHCQRFPGLQTWLSKRNVDEVKPLLFTRREFPYHRWEPIYIGTNDEPLYSELLSWEGRQDKMTQMLELCLRSYRMVVLDGCFLVHATTNSHPQHNTMYERMNSKYYAEILNKFNTRYKTNDRCRVK